MRVHRARTSAFTLIEALVAIGAMALVAVGLAAIFQSVGRTVGNGKRLSVLNQQAAIIEQQMRAHFQQMSRDGVLVVRNQLTTNPGTPPQPRLVQVWPDDPAPRARRIDEIMFVAKGRFTSAREPLDPAYVASSEFARIYYGHGARLPETNANYARPRIDESNKGAGRLGDSGGPNEYGVNWTLLCQQTLLAKPAPTSQALPPGKVFSYDPARSAGREILKDKTRQISLQPAASSLFRSLSRYTPPRSNVLRRFRQFIREDQFRANPPDGYAVFTSGIIDIANTDVSDLRTLVTSGAVGGTRPAGIVNQGSYHGPAGSFTPGPAALDTARAWIEDLMPAPSDASYPYNAALETAGTRVRAESAPPDYIGVLSQYSSAKDAPEAAYRRSDQLMLSASNFLAACTEFIAEWSFGEVDPTTNETVWHGLDRSVDTDGDGTLDRVVVRPYPLSPSSQQVVHTQHFSKSDGSDGTKLVPAELVDGTNVPAPAVSRTAMFGTVFPLATPADAIGGPWAWPSMIRVTLTLADPRDPATQQTFQFVFNVPANPG